MGGRLMGGPVDPCSRLREAVLSHPPTPRWQPAPTRRRAEGRARATPTCARAILATVPVQSPSSRVPAPGPQPKTGKRFGAQRNAAPTTPPRQPTTSHACLAAAAPSRYSNASAATPSCAPGGRPLSRQLAAAEAMAGAAMSTEVTCAAPATPAATLKPPV